MKLSIAAQQFAEGRIVETEIRRSPGNTAEWFVSVLGTSSDFYLLVDDNNKPIAEKDINRLLILIEDIGFPDTKILF